MTPMPRGGIRLRSVGKQFIKYEDTPTLAYGLLHAFGRSHRSKLWAVSGIDLDIAPGETVGLMGRNGSGKTTLLSMLCGVTSPTSGELRIGGRIAPLISVGVGFHPELTGRENVFVNGTILGLSRREIEQRIDEIVEFAEIGSFLDTPVKFYSSGMFVRLGFSVAAHVSPDVLLVDEVLAVGDAAFQLKCFKYMTKLRDEGTTIVIVSHNMAALEKHCDRGVLLESGKLAFDGSVSDSLSAYYEMLGQAMLDQPGDHAETGEREGPRLDLGLAEIVSAELIAEDGSPGWTLDAGQKVSLVVRLRALEAIRAPYLGLTVISSGGVGVYRDNNLYSPYGPMAKGTVRTFRATFGLELVTGSFQLEYAMGRANPIAGEPLDDDVALFGPPRRLNFYVRGRNHLQGLADLRATFA